MSQYARHPSALPTLTGGFRSIHATDILNTVAAFAVTKSVRLQSASSQYVDLGNNFRFQPTDAFTISAWFCLSSTASYGVIVGNQGNSAGYNLAVLSGGAPKIEFQFYTAGGGSLTVRSSTLSPNRQWHHVVISVDGTNDATGCKLYLDGVLDTTVAANTPLATPSYNVSTRIGADGFGDYLNGYVNNLSIWSAALTAGQVTALYNNGNPKNLAGSANLMAWYRLGDGTDTSTTIYDQVGALNGTIVHSATIVSFAPFTVSFNRALIRQVKNNPNVAIPADGYLYIPYYASGNPTPGFDAPDMEKWSTADALAPVLVGTIATTYPTNVSPFWLTFGAGNYGFMPSWKSVGVQVIDPASCSAVASFDTNLDNSSSAVIADSTTAYVIGNTSGLTAGSAAIVDITDPLNPSILSYFTIPLDTFGAGQRAVITGGHLFVTGHDASQLKVYDISTPRSPSLVATMSTAAAPTTLTLDPRGQYLYISEGDGSSGALEIVDISTPASPSSVLTLSVDAFPAFAAFCASRNLLLVPSAHVGTITAIDVTDPANAVPVGRYDLGLDGYGLQKKGAAISCLGHTLYVTNLSDPGSGIGSYYGYLDVLTVSR